MNNSNNQGSNLSPKDRKKGGQHSQGGQGSAKDGRGSNLTPEDRSKGGQHSHGNNKK